MATLTILIFICVCLSAAIQMTFISNVWLKWGWYLCMALFVYFIHPFAIEQSYDSIKTYLADKNLIANFVVLLIIESSLGFIIALNLIDRFYRGKLNSWIFAILDKFIGVSFFIALFYLECFSYFSLAGISFELLAVIMAAVLPLAMLLLEKGTTFFMQETDLRIDLKIILHLIPFVVGIVLSITVLRLPLPSQENDLVIAIKGLLAFVALALICFIIGYKYKKRTKKTL